MVQTDTQQGRDLHTPTDSLSDKLTNCQPLKRRAYLFEEETEEKGISNKVAWNWTASFFSFELFPCSPSPIAIRTA